MLETICGNVEMKMYFVCMTSNGNVEMKMYFVCISSNRDVRTLIMIKEWAAINCSKSRSTFKSFLNWWPETME
jgi:hypothetical protein